MEKYICPHCKSASIPVVTWNPDGKGKFYTEALCENCGREYTIRYDPSKGSRLSEMKPIKVDSHIRKGRPVRQHQRRKSAGPKRWYVVIYSYWGAYGFQSRHKKFMTYKKAAEYANTLDAYTDNAVGIEYHIEGDFIDTLEQKDRKIPSEEPRKWVEEYHKYGGS